MAISTAAIRAAKPDAVLNDADVPGLHVRIGREPKPGKGSATKLRGATYALRYRTKAGRQRRQTIGSARGLTLTQAREAARGILAKVALGEDPAAATAAARAAPTVAQICADYLADDDVKAKKTYAADQWQIDKYILPRWKTRKAASITAAGDFKNLRKDMAKTPIQFNRVLALCSTLFNYAGIAPNPTEGVKRYPEKKRRRYMSADEAVKIAALLDAAESREPRGVAFIRLLILTGMRCGEVSSAQWDWLEDSYVEAPDKTMVRRGVLRHPDAKTGAREIFLSPAAMAVIDTLPRVGERIVGIDKPAKLWRSIRKKAGCPDLRLHDLRHSFASVGLSEGLTLAQIGELLGHSSPATTARYAHLIEEHKHAAADQIAQASLARMKPKALPSPA